jgi:non-homologous end joining protein Ku
LEPEELDEVALESTTLDIESFVPRKEIDEIYLDTPAQRTRASARSRARASALSVQADGNW